MTFFSNASVIAVPNKTTHIQMIQFSDDSILKSALNNFGLVSNGTIFERITETKILKQIHSNPFSYGNGVMATGPKKFLSFLLDYFVFKKLLLKYHKNFWFYENLIRKS